MCLEKKNKAPPSLSILLLVEKNSHGKQTFQTVAKAQAAQQQNKQKDGEGYSFHLFIKNISSYLLTCPHASEVFLLAIYVFSHLCLSVTQDRQVTWHET